MRIRKTRRGVEVTVADTDAAVLTHCARQLLELLGAGEQASDDPLAELVGLSSTSSEPPADPALARLLPDAYRDDPQAAGDFRRFTEADLRAGKRAACETVLALLPPAGGMVLLDRETAGVFLGWLNDLRLVLGTRLGVTEETDADVAWDADDEERQALAVYGWLGWVQETLLQSLMPRR